MRCLAPKNDKKIIVENFLRVLYGPLMCPGLKKKHMYVWILTNQSNHFTYVYFSGDLDCLGQWSACTSACEAAGQRSFAETQAQSGNGAACSTTTTDCQPGQDHCPRNYSWLAESHNTCWFFLANLGLGLKIVWKQHKTCGQIFLLFLCDELKNILVSAHGNSLRAICKKIFNISDTMITKLEIPTGNPIFIEMDSLRVNSFKYLDKARSKEIITNQ